MVAFSFRPMFMKVGVTAVALSLLLATGLLLSPQNVSADVCTGSAIAFGYNDTDDDPCDTSEIFANDAKAENSSSPWSAGLAWARAETDSATLARPTYAWSFNTNTTLGGALSGNSVKASNVTGADVFSPNGSAYAISQNTDSKLVLAGAKNNVDISDVVVSQDAIQGNVRADSSNTRCYLCEAGSSNEVNINGASSNTAGIVNGGIYANAFNTDASHSMANAVNSVNISNSHAEAFILNDSNGSYASAINTGGSSADCMYCFATAFNTLDIDDVDAGNGYNFLNASRAVAQNDYSSGSSALGVNNAEFRSIYVDGSPGLDQVYGYAFNDWSPDSSAVGINHVLFEGLENSRINADNLSNGSLWSEGRNDWCYTCTAEAYNDIHVDGTTGPITVAGSIFGGGASANAWNDGGSNVIGFGDNTAIATNTIHLEGPISTGGLGSGSIDAQTQLPTGPDLISQGVYSYAHNYTGEQNENDGYCYECIAVADNFLKIVNSSSGETMVDTDVYAFAENYNSYEVLAKSTNKVVIKDTSAGVNIIADPDLQFGSVFAYTTNRYCDECEATAGNFVLIDNNSTPGTVLNGHAYAWAENNLDNLTMFSAEAEEEEGNQNTATAYNTLIIQDNNSGETTALFVGSIVDANVYSCASNNVGGDACGGRCISRICEESASALDVYEGDCTNCQAYANNYVKVTGDSTIDPIGIEENSGVGIFAHAENTAQGVENWGACDTCLAGAVNVVNAENGSNVNGPTSSTAVNMNSENVAAGAANVLNLDDSSGSAEAKATNTYAENSVAVAANLTTADDESTVESFVGASNENTDGALALAGGTTHATNGGNASSETSASVGNIGGGTNSGVAIAASNTTADGGSASTVTTADLTNDGTSSGVAYSVSYDANGNVAVAVVITEDGDGVAVAYTNATNANVTADAQADGSGGETSGDVTYSEGTPEAHTDVSTAP